MIRTALIVLFLLAACTKPPSGEAYSFTLTFDELAKAHNYYVPTSSITIDFPDLGGPKEKIDCSGKHVSIDAKVWANTLDGYREAAIFHVLAHCLIPRGHRAGNTTTGSAISEPWSLMNPDFVPGELYVGDKQKYVDELFTAPFPNDTAYP